MTWLYGGFGGGETLDALIEGCSGTAGAPTILCGGMDIITSPVKYGVGALRIPSGQVGGAALMETCASTKMYCFQAWVNYNGNPTAAHAIFHSMLYYSPAAHYALEVGTDRRVRIVLLNISLATCIPLTDWSVAVLGNGDWTHLVWIFDPLTLGTNHVWHTVLIDNVVQICADLGVWPAALDGGPNTAYLLGTAAINIGVDLRLDDICGLSSTNSANAPHITAVQVVTVDAQHPSTDTGATSSSWLPTPHADPHVYYDKWDDATGNDGDTTYLSCLAILEQEQTSGMESLATLGWDASATVLQYAAGVGPVWSVVHKTASSKWDADAISSLSTDEVVTKPGAAYGGRLKRLTRTGGGSWSRADVGNIFAGAQIGPDGVDAAWVITSLMLQWVLCNNVYLPLTPAPMIPQSSIF